jgi:hypothetical protein
LHPTRYEMGMVQMHIRLQRDRLDRYQGIKTGLDWRDGDGLYETPRLGPSSAV